MDSVRQTRSRTRQVSGDSIEDRISDLPCDILDKILISLPIQEAARTSILSKRWRFRWRYTPKLVFDGDGCSDSFFSNFTNSHKGRREVVTWIYQIFQLQRGPLHKFVLFIPSWVEVDPCLINKILLCLAKKGIREFAFYRYFTGLRKQLYYRLPSTVFRFGHLTHLNLSLCTLTIPPNFIGFSSLVDVELCKVYISNNDLSTFISSCPLLLHLKLQQTIHERNRLEIDAPNLKFLFFSYSSVSIIFRNVPLLSTLSIISLQPQPVKHLDIGKMFRSLPTIEHFYADESFIMNIYVGVIPETLPVILSNLNSVELCGLCFTSMKQVQSALFLIRSSPNLQRLRITSRFKSFNCEPMSQLYKTIRASEDCLNQLQEITMEKFLGLEPELEFLKLILARSLVLEKVTICPVKRFLVEDERESFLAVTQLQRSSPKVELIYVDPK